MKTQTATVCISILSICFFVSSYFWKFSFVNWERKSGYLPFITCVFVGKEQGWMPRGWLLKTGSLWAKRKNKVKWIECLLSSFWTTGLFCFIWKSVNKSQFASKNLTLGNLKLPRQSDPILAMGFCSFYFIIGVLVRI